VLKNKKMKTRTWRENKVKNLRRKIVKLVIRVLGNVRDIAMVTKCLLKFPLAMGTKLLLKRYCKRT